MRTSLLALASAIALLSSAAQASNFDFGVGVGLPYSGLGASTKYFPTRSSAVGISAGCVSFSSFGSDSCGFGVSYERTDFLSSSSDQHSIGAYLGIVGSENVLRGSSIERESNYGGSLFYSYYLNELAEPGFHFGGSVSAADENSGTEITIGLNLGYRF